MTITPEPLGGLTLIDKIRSRRLPGRARRRQIREDAGATIRDVADECGVSPFAVYSWEKPGGTVEPKPCHRVIYKRVLDELESLAQEQQRTL